MKRVQKLYHLLATPVFYEDEEKSRQAYLINRIIQTGLLLLVAIFVILPWMSTSSIFFRFLFVVISVFCALLFSKVMLNQGHVWLSGHFLSAALWLIFAIVTLTGPEGLTGTPFLCALTLTPLIAGFVSGTRASIIITFLNWALGGVLVQWEVNGRIPIVAVHEPFVQYLSYVVMFSVLPILVYLWRRNFADAIAQVRVADNAQRETAVYRLQNEQLEEAVKARTRDLEDSLKREQRLAEQITEALAGETLLGELQSRIITVVSHEFRTPLSVIFNSAELLHQYYDKLPQDKRDAAHQRIEDAIFYLNELLKGVTLVDRAQRERIQPIYQTYAFNELCQNVISRLSPAFTQPLRVTFQYAAAVTTTVQTDLTLLTQAIDNLIANSLKFSEQNQPVQVKIRLKNDWLVVEVQDEGIGIPLNEQARIFELFYRASNVDERRGLGLGLFAVKAICTKMQGRVGFVSKGQDQGATFQISLPRLVPHTADQNQLEHSFL